MCVGLDIPPSSNSLSSSISGLSFNYQKAHAFAIFASSGTD